MTIIKKPFNTYIIEKQKQFLNACQNNNIDTMKKLMISEHSLDSDITTNTINIALASSLLSTNNQKNIIDYLNIVLIQKQFEEACQFHDLNLIKNILSHSETNRHIHITQLVRGYEKAISRFLGNPQSSEVEEYLKPLLVNYKNTFIQANQENNINYFKEHLPDYVDRQQINNHWSFYCEQFLQELYYFACQNGNVEIIEFLFESPDLVQKPKIDGDFYKALLIACEYNQIPIIHYLINHQPLAPFNRSLYSGLPLPVINTDTQIYFNNHEAFLSHCEHNLQNLFTKYTTIENFKNDFIVSLNHQSCSYFYKDSQNFIDQLSIQFCRSGNLEAVDFIMSHVESHCKYINIFSKHIEKFDNACYSGNLELVKILFQPPFNADNSYINQGIKSACQKGHIDVIDFIILNNTVYNSHLMIQEHLDTICRSGQATLLEHIITSPIYDKPLSSFVNSVPLPRTFPVNITSLESLLSSIQSEESICNILEILYIKHPKLLTHSTTEYNKLFFQALEYKELKTISFFIENPQIKHALSYTEVDIFSKICNKENYMPLLEYFLCNKIILKDEFISNYIGMIKDNRNDSPKISKLKEAISYAEKLFNIVSLNDKLQSMPIKKDVIYKKNKI